MTELFLLVVFLSFVGMGYGFYDVVHTWLKPRVERLAPKIKKLIPDPKPLLKKVRHRLANPKPKPRRPIAPYDIVDEAHASHARRENQIHASRVAKDIIDAYQSPLSGAPMWRANLKGINAGATGDRSQLGRSISPEERYRSQMSQSAQALQSLNQAENDKFWNQIAEECYRATGSADFRSPDPNLGLKKRKAYKK